MVFFCCSHALSLSHISHRSLSSLPLVKNHKLSLPSVATYPLLIDRKSMQSHQTLIDLLLFLLLLCRFHRHRKSTHSNEVLKIAIGDFQELFRPGLHSITTSLTHSNKVLKSHFRDFQNHLKPGFHPITTANQRPCHHGQCRGDDPKRFGRWRWQQSSRTTSENGTFAITKTTYTRWHLLHFGIPIQNSRFPPL
jgi:hypothetical protein